MYVFKLEFSSFPEVYPGEEFLDHKVDLFSVFKGTSILFSTVAAPIYIPLNSVGAFLKTSIFNPYFTDKETKVQRHEIQFESPSWRVTQPTLTPRARSDHTLLALLFYRVFYPVILKYKHRLQME